MKKRFLTLALAAVMACSMLTGCSTKTSQKIDQYRKIGIQQMDQGDYEGAILSFQHALDQSTGVISPIDKDTVLYKALAQIRNGQKNDALETYTALVDYDKKYWKGYFLRGNLELNLGKNEDAFADYEKAVELNDAIQLYVSIYQNLMACGQESKAVSYMQAAEGKTSATGEDYYWLAQLYLINGDYNKAMEYASKAESSGFEDGALIGARILIAMGQSEQAKDKLDIYVEKHPDDPAAMGQLGVIAFAAKEYDLAINYIEKAMNTEGFDNNPDTLKNLVAAYEFKGDFKKAADIAKSYLDLYPTDEEMEREVEFLDTRVMGNFVKEEPAETEGTEGTAEGTAEGSEGTAEGTASEGTGETQSTEGETSTQ